MPLDRNQFNQFIDLLSDFVTTESERRTLIQRAFFRETIVESIDYSGQPVGFSTNCLTRLESYNGDTALIQLLETLRDNYLGSNRQGEAQTLIDELRVHLTTNKSAITSVPTPTAISQLDPDAPKVFISYSRVNSETAREVRDRLQAFGYRTWIDMDDIGTGEYWPDAIDRGLDESDVVVGVLSEASVQSRNVKNEWDWALQYDVPLYLLRIENCRVPHRYVSINWIDLIEDRESGYARLKAALEAPTETNYSLDSKSRPKLSRTRVAKVPATPQTPPEKPLPVTETGEMAQLDPTERRNRQFMLEKARKFWIEGVLENSLHESVMIDLGTQSQFDAVEHPFNARLRHDDYADDIQVGMGIASIFDKMAGELLILGQPGSGKTTMLLQLARDLVEQAEQDVTQPIPVIFNLSSWADERKSIEVWLVDELNAQYQVPRNVGEKWVANDNLLLLLDGLDEVQLEHRNACVTAINDFRSQHGPTKIVVCSRITDYEALTEKLKLQGAILIQPLSMAQVDSYLSQFGDDLRALRELIKSDEGMAELAETPLMVSIMVMAYRGVDVQEVSNLGTLDEKRDHLFGAYVDRMFDRRGDNAEYTRKQTIHWLAWLAKQMVERSQTLFLIERMQPDWLPQSNQSRFDLQYKTLASLLYGVSVGIACAFAVMYATDIFSIGAIFGLGVSISLAIGVWNARSRAFGLVGSGAFGLSFGLTFGITTALYANFGQGLLVGTLASISLALIYAFGGRSLLGTRETRIDQIEIVETIRWSWRKMLQGVHLVGFAGLAVGLSVGATGAVLYSPIEGLFAGLAGGFAASFATLIPFGLLSGQVDERTQPNQGIVRSVNIATVVAAIVALLSGIPAGLTMGTIGGILVGVSTGVGIGAACSIFVWFQFGGRTGIKHFILRNILHNHGLVPRDLSDFLDYCVKLIFIRRVGGGYIFIHRTLLEYFASLELDS